MLKWFNRQHNLLKYFICITLTLICLFLIREIFLNNYTYDAFKYDNSTYEKREIIDKNKYYDIKVQYPKFTNTRINKIISDYVFDYVKDFKGNAKINDTLMNTLIINYNLSFLNNHLNIFFKINNSLDLKNNTKSILISLEDYKLSTITEVYEEEFLKNKINTNVFKKYPLFISNKILESDINSFNYDINNDLITVYFNNIEFDNIDYKPYITISLVQDVFSEEYIIDPTKKLVALTFDDGPGEHTMEIVENLRLNNAKGTFFMLGNRMKYNPYIVESVYLSGNEIGSHSYSHKNLTRISNDELLTEINTPVIIYNQITTDNLKYLRPPYGSTDDRLIKTTPFPLIKWSIDPEDWLSRNPEMVYNHILEKVYDGAIILLHDIYPETVEAIKLVIPELKSRGYELVTISKLAELKGYTLTPGQIVREMP